MKTKHPFLTLTLLLAAVSIALGQPVITTEPQSRTNVVGTDATFTVVATGTEPLAYQWRFGTVDLSGKTNDTLIVTNVQTTNAGSYTVVVSNVDDTITSAVATLTVIVPPTITRQPTNQSASLGANVTFSVVAAGTAPRYVQWRFNETNLPGKTSTSLVMTNVQLTNAGDYTVVVTNLGGSITSQVATLTVDPTFTKIASGPVVTNGGFGFGCAWGDYDNDGFIDLFVCNDDASQSAFLYRNNGDGTFVRITSGPMLNDGVWATGAAWGDHDNDGNLDIYVVGPVGGGTLGPNRLYHNNGNGTFTKITTGLLVTQPLYSHAGVWADFDNDGLIDLFAVNFTFFGGGVTAPDNYRYLNTGDGTFNRISFGTKSLTDGDSWNVAAADFNNDGWIDLFVPQGGMRSRQNNLLYTNSHDGSFTLQTNSIVFTDGGNSVACAWGDYDNDGFLDLFVSNSYGQNNFLYHNNGDGTFTAITNSPVTLDGGTSLGCAWGDYENDGWLDLFVANLGPVDPNDGSSIAPENNFLYHNNGDGTFTKITTGSPVNDLGYSAGCAWGDYDNDGFLDLFVSNGWVTKSENNFLYRNNGNSNNWIKFKLVGTASNRAAIGAKVRVKATIGGNAIWQMREISGGSNYGSQDDMRPSFGLGDATNIDLVRIEWPSGIVQTLTNEPAKQFLTVVEHQAPGAVTTPPSFTSVSRSTNGVVDLSVTGDPGLLYLFESSTNLVNWSWLGVRTNLTGTIQFTDPKATNYAKRFYRVSIP